MKVTSVFSKNISAYNKGYRYIANKGSTRSSKTFSVLQLLALIALNSETDLTISVVSQSMPHLKKGCIKDFRTILIGEGLWDENRWNATDKVYNFGKGKIEFFSVDNSAKAHGPARDILYINECINVRYEVYTQLAIRTTKTIFLDCNPNFKFWLDTNVLKVPLDPDDENCKVLVDNPKAYYIHSTYKDNDMLTQRQIDEIESRKHDKNWWKVYGLGETGSFLGAIMDNWDVVDSMPAEYKKRWIGIDFGFTNDPTAIVDVRLSDGELWIDQLLFAPGFDNMMICDRLEQMKVPKNIDIVADSAEPKSIAEIRTKGWRVQGAIKGTDSITQGLSILGRYVKHLTNTSEGIIDEFTNYRWREDMDGNPINVPIDRFNHAIDAIRYVALNFLGEKGSFSYSRIK